MMWVPGHDDHPVQGPRKLTLRLTLLLYLVTILVEAVRKVSGLPAGTDSIIYIIVGIIYFWLLPGIRNRIGTVPNYLPVWLALLTVWCFAEAVIPGVPLSMALLGWASYVFFVPLFYIGAELMATDSGAVKTLRFVAISGGILGLGALASAVLGQSAPIILQPIVASVGLHSFSTGNIYLAPSLFATAEQAAEELLIALFAWIALAYLTAGRRRGRTFSALVGILIAIGLFATARRADIAVAIIGVASLLFLNSRTGQHEDGYPILHTSSRTNRPAGLALVLGAAGSLILLSFLGASRVLPFLTSRSDGLNALTLMFSPADPAALSGQGTGTSTQGAGVLGATTFAGIRNHQAYAGYIQGGKAFIAAEGGMTKTWLELGIVGVILYAGIFFCVLGPGVHSLRQLDAVARALTVLTLALGIVFLKGHASLDDPLIQPLFWLAAGGIWGRLRAHGKGPAAFKDFSTCQASRDGVSREAAPQAPLG